MPRKKSEVDEAKEVMTAKTPRVRPYTEADLCSTGLTVVNLAVGGRRSGSLPKGTYVYFVGDSSSGKTWFAMSLLAEAARNPAFDGYRFIYDPVESGAMMDIEKYFGRKLAERIEVRDPPSKTLQEFYMGIDAELDKGPLIWVEDSFDGLNDETEEEVFAAERKQFETGTGQVPGSMGMQKAKYHSNHINRVVKRLHETRSMLFGISQTRDKINSPIPGQKTHGGGKALKFYSHVQVWTSVKGPIKKTVMGKEREIGSVIALDIQKNRISGWEGKVFVPFYRSHGLDELGSCVDYLLEEGHWSTTKVKGKKDQIAAPEFGFEGTRDQLIAHIEAEDAERELQVLVADLWTKIEEASAVKRKPRYE